MAIHSTRRIAYWTAGLAAVALALGTAPALAEITAATARTQHAEVRLLPAAEGLGADGQARMGVEFTLDPGWHIYWRSPGDAGLPPEFDWSASTNLESHDLHWPVPERVELLGILTSAYEDHVIFPVDLIAADPGAPLDLQLDISFLICADICIPDQASLSLALPSGGGGATSYVYDIDRFEAEVPVAPQQAGLQLSQVGVAGDAKTGVLTVGLTSTAPLTEIDLLAEAGPDYFFDRAEASLSANGYAATLSVPVETWLDDINALAELPITLTVIAGERAMEQSLIPASFNPDAPLVSVTPAERGATPVAAAEPVDSATFLTLLGIALLGGLVLNLMPCVLPVLSLKILSVVGHGGGDRRDVRRGFLASAAGILVSFLVLAVAAIGLRDAGVAVGWGMQFQQPIFLAVMLVIVALFAYSLFGLFEIRLPGAISDVAASAGGPGPSKSLRSHFLTGAFATLLATPCSAPFVGTALGFALSRGSLEIISIFAAMGIGLALPYLLIALFPKIATRLPRPGRWMAWVTRVLGLALVATAIWLATVLAGQIGWEAAGGIVAFAALIGAVFAVRRFVPEARIGKHAGYLAAGLAIAAVVSAVFAPQVARISTADGLAWTPFDRDAIPDLVADGKTVFVDVTADWCLTCIYNKTAVLEQNPVRAALTADESVVAMIADWTNPDPAIADYLASFGRYGIPFNVVYGPDAPAGIALPELLTESAVLTAIAAASAGGGGAIASR